MKEKPVNFVQLRAPVIVLAQMTLVTLSLLGSYVLRFDVVNFGDQLGEFVRVLPYFLGVKLFVFYFFGLYRGWWRYVGMSDLLDIVKAALSSLPLIYLLVTYVGRIDGFSRSLFLIDAMLTICIVGGVRFAIRAYTESVASHEGGTRDLLVVGAGLAGRTLVRETRQNASIGLNAVGFVDDDPSKRGVRLEGVRVLGRVDELPELAKRLGVREVLIAIPTASGEEMSRIVGLCQRAGVTYKTVPAFADMINGTFSLSEVRDVQIEDLLGRDVVEIETNVIRRSLAGKTVLVTGAGGSIGSELSRQIASFGPKRLILFERSENDLYRIDLDLRKRYPLVDIVPAAGDILDLNRLNEIFFEYRPSAVLHAAAYKHVPMMEHQPFMAVRNNVFGTYNLTRASYKYGVESFLLISSDKAVNPANVMGVTKRIAEIIVLGFASLGKGRYNAVRFGNVLGSSGSVVPLFKEQIAARQPVTVTDPEVKRYFMTIPEAVRLVLQASTMGTGGEIFVLDMGKPVKIVDLARNLIRLSGLEPDRDIPIVFTGLRPGEKRYEELLLGTEGVVPTTHPKVMQLRSNLPEPKFIGEIMRRLDTTSRSRDMGALVETLVTVVPEFTPSPSLMRLAESRSGSVLSRLESGQRDEDSAVQIIPKKHPLELLAEVERAQAEADSDGARQTLTFSDT